MLPCVFSWCLPHLANKLDPDLIFLTRSGVHLWEMLTIKPESLPLCSTGMTRIKFCSILTIWICSLSSYGKETVALRACAFFQLEVKSTTKGHLKQTERLADTQPTQSRNQDLWEVDVFVVLMMKIVCCFCSLFYNSLLFDITRVHFYVALSQMETWYYSDMQNYQTTNDIHNHSIGPFYVNPTLKCCKQLAGTVTGLQKSHSNLENLTSVSFKITMPHQQQHSAAGSLNNVQSTLATPELNFNVAVWLSAVWIDPSANTSFKACFRGGGLIILPAAAAAAALLCVQRSVCIFQRAKVTPDGFSYSECSPAIR